jgi:O-antigen/teichoic acid export membrane protein
MMEKPYSRIQIVKSLIWKLSERIGAQGVLFVIQIIIARILMPEDYGLLALISIFITVSNVIIQTGFSSAIIQTKNIDDEDLSSVFFISLIISILLYLGIFLISPYISLFYGNEKITLVLRVYALVLIIGVFSSIPLSLITRKLLFRQQFFTSLLSIIISGATGIF